MISIFNIIGPVMIGPSSSHTSGASSLGLFAKYIFGEKINNVKMLLHGSFAEVYKGHMSDKALVAGLLGMRSDDVRLINSFEMASNIGLQYQIIPTTLGDGYHPNTVKFEFPDNKYIKSIIGSSIGGGAIQINAINDINVENIDGNSDTAVFFCNDKQKAENIIKKMGNKIDSYKFFENGDSIIGVVSISQNDWTVFKKNIKKISKWFRFLPALS